MKNTIGFVSLLDKTQAYLSAKHPDALNDKKKYEEVKPLIKQFIRANGYFVNGLTTEELVDTLYADMVEYSFLTDYLNSDAVEEININAWNDVAVHFVDGSVSKSQHFYSPEHAENIVKRLLQHSGMHIDNAMPKAVGHLPGNARIAALKSPLVDDNVTVSASIRLLHPSKIDTGMLVESGSAMPEMLEFLVACLNYGVSFVIAGATFSGKTTLLNALLRKMPYEKRIITIESGARELKLVQTDDDGNVLTNVLHLLSRPSEREMENIDQEDLVNLALRLNPALIVIGEMRDSEAYSAVDAALTGNTIVSTIHSYSGQDAHMRLASLCLRRHDMGLDIAMMEAAKAFPIVCYEQKLGTDRKIMNISECVIGEDGKRSYRTLYRYVVQQNDIVDGKTVVVGHFEKVSCMSEYLRERMINYGAPNSILDHFKGKGSVQ